MNKNIKTALIILIGILALVTVVGFVYGMQNKSDAKDIYTSYDENILSAVDSAIKVCESAFKDVSATEDEKLVAAKTKLTAARNYNSTTDKSQEQN